MNRHGYRTGTTRSARSVREAVVRRGILGGCGYGGAVAPQRHLLRSRQPPRLRPPLPLSPPGAPSWAPETAPASAALCINRLVVHRSPTSTAKAAMPRTTTSAILTSRNVWPRGLRLSRSRVATSMRLTIRLPSADRDHALLKLLLEKRSEFSSHVAANVLQKPSRAHHALAKQR